MKTLLVSAVLALSTMASASTLILKEGDKALTLLTEGQVRVESKIHACPKIDMCDPVATLKIKFNLGGCMDTLGPVTITEAGVTAEGKKKFVVTAFVVNNVASTYTKCLMQPFAIVEKHIGLGFLTADDVEVEFAKSFLSK